MLKFNMLVRVHTTPNPLSYQFSIDEPFVEFGHHAFYPDSETDACPIARALLSTEGVAHILITPLFLTVTLTDAQLWPSLEQKLTQIIEQHIQNLPLVTPKESAPLDKDELWLQVADIMEKYVTPAIASHGGFIQLDRIEDNIVFVKLQGACDNCPSALSTLQNGITNLLQFYIPSIQEVRSSN